MKKICWFSKHPLLRVQKDALREMFGEDAAFEWDNRTFDDASIIKARFEGSGCDVLVAVAPLWTLVALWRAGLRPYYAKGERSHGKRWRFTHFELFDPNNVVGENPAHA